MSPTQLALLILGGVAIIAIYVYSRRDRPKLQQRPRRAAPPVESVRPTAEQPDEAPKTDQMDMFSRLGEFDELGVGKPRKRVSPSVPGGAPAPAAAAPVEEKLVALLIAEREGTAIFGERIHAALNTQALQYGERKIYHRIVRGQPVFSVASLIKPGHLDPRQQQFSTPGLSVFMVLPGPMAPDAALADMIATTRALAHQLNAEVFDSSREVFTASSESALVADVKAWARLNGH